MRRKWGFYIVLLSRKRFKVKLLRFKRGASISLQRHQHRAELWLFLSGFGNMLDRFCRAGEFYLIPVNTWHKYTAKRKTWILEIQYGDKCDEGDIERK